MDFDTWFGVLRREIAWYPRIDPVKCVGFGLCTNSYPYDFADRRGVVKPYNCLVGCMTCGNLCPAGAIEFPGPKEARDAVRKYGVFKVVKELLKEKHREFMEKAEKYGGSR